MNYVWFQTLKLTNSVILKQILCTQFVRVNEQSRSRNKNAIKILCHVLTRNNKTFRLETSQIKQEIRHASLPCEQHCNHYHDALKKLHKTIGVYLSIFIQFLRLENYCLSEEVNVANQALNMQINTCSFSLIYMYKNKQKTIH